MKASGKSKPIITDFAYLTKLIDKPIDELRALYPADCVSRAETIRYCKVRGLTRGQLVADIVEAEFPVFTTWPNDPNFDARAR